MLHIGVRSGSWRLFTCSDCHPDNDENSEYDEPYQVVLPLEPVDAPDGGRYNLENPESACPIDTCPRCGSYLSLLAEDAVQVTLQR